MPDTVCRHSGISLFNVRIAEADRRCSELPTCVNDRDDAHTAPTSFFIPSDTVDKSDLNDKAIFGGNRKVHQPDLHATQRLRSVPQCHLQTRAGLRLSKQSRDLHATDSVIPHREDKPDNWTPVMSSAPEKIPAT